MPYTRSQTAQETTVNTQCGSSTSSSDIATDNFELSEQLPESTTYSAEDVFEWEFDGIVYLKDKEEFVYDIFTGENIGYFDGENLLDLEENGVWVLQSTQTEIIPNEEVHSETELLQNKVELLEQELVSKDNDIRFHLKVLSNKDRFIQQSENIRTHLLQKQDDINSKYIKLLEEYQRMEVDYNTLKDEEQTVAPVIQNSGAVSQEINESSSGMTYAQISEELTRKENVIRRKDAKATRLINIIREKNLILIDFQNKMQETTRYQWMLSSNIKTLSDEIIAWKNYYASNTTGQIPNTTEYTVPTTTGSTYQSYNGYGNNMGQALSTDMDTSEDHYWNGEESSPFQSY